LVVRVTVAPSTEALAVMASAVGPAAAEAAAVSVSVRS